MFYKFVKGEQRKLLLKAIAKAGSERKLAELSGIPESSIYFLKFEKRNISERYLAGLIKFLNINMSNLKNFQILPSNWGQIKGGKNLIKQKRRENTLQETVERLRKVSSKRMIMWHKYMKKNHPEKYHVLQYERFKKIDGGYKFILKNGVKVRNKLEKEVGNFLVDNFFGFKYEPYLNINGNVYFPDFLYKKVIIEVTEWKSPDNRKIRRLATKIKDYRTAGYVVCFYIPSAYRKFYKELDSPVLSNLSKLGAHIASVA
jgi:hypothetical protein